MIIQVVLIDQQLLDFPVGTKRHNMRAQLDNIHVEDLPYLERDLNFTQKVSLSFLLYGDQHAHATYILQKLLALARAPISEQMHSDLLRMYAQTNPIGWRDNLIEALCIINARKPLRKLGLRWEQLRLHYLPTVKEFALHVHPLLKALYVICEELTISQAGRLVLNINEQLSRRPTTRSSADEQLRFYDFNYLEIFFLDWLTRRHMRLGEINAVDSDVQILIEYFKFNDLNSLATLLTDTVNTNSAPTEINKIETDYVTKSEDILKASNPTPQIEKTELPTNSSDARRQKGIQVNRERAGIVLIINQQCFHRNVNEELQKLLPSEELGKRGGTDVDKEQLSNVFSAMGYTVEAHDNVDHLALLDLIRSVCARTIMRDSLIVCILSHGFEGAVYGADSIPLSITDIKNVLCGYDGLHDKPKLLLIQACQQVDPGNQKTREINANTSSPIQNANMVVAMSTVPGFKALRHTIKGSWFIQTLCETIVEHAATEHINDILTIAIAKISEKRGDKNEKMLPIWSSTLTRNLYFPAI